METEVIHMSKDDQFHADAIINVPTKEILVFILKQPPNT